MRVREGGREGGASERASERRTEVRRNGDGQADGRMKVEALEGLFVGRRNSGRVSERGRDDRDYQTFFAVV